MARTQTMVQLTAELLASLDSEAARLGCSRSALIREAIEARLAATKQAEQLRRYVDGYRMTPQGNDSHVGERRRQTMASRLDQEEERAGLSW